MKVVAAATALVFASVLSGIAIAFAAGGLNPAAAVASFLVGLGAAFLAVRTCPADPLPKPGPWDWILFTIFALASLRGFLWVVGARGDEIFVLSPNNLGDVSLHINFIRYLASGVPFWPESPILTGTPLTYPLGVDLFNSLLELCGVETFRGIVWVGLTGAALTGLALWRWGGAFTLAAFLFNGGLAGFAIFQSGHFEDFQAALIWKNFFLSMFITQRGLLLALPAGLLLLTAWREEFFRGRPPRIARWLQFVLYAAMPLFSLHTFLFLSAVLGGIFILRASSRRPLGLFVAAAVLPASLCVLLVTGNFHASGGLHMAGDWLPNFYTNDMDKGWISVLKDFGLTLPLALATVILAIRKKEAEARCFAGLAVAVFGICGFVAFTRWEWDNMKLMMWCWLAIAPYLWTLVLRPLQWPAQAALCFLLFFSGAVSLFGGLDARHGYPIASRSELASWQAAVRNIPATDRFAAVPDYNHPLILLGRKVACGYEGHLWSHGLDYAEKMALTKDALRGAVSWQDAAPRLNVQWGALRRTDRPDFVNASIGPKGIGALYDLRPCLTPDPASPAPRPPPPRSVGSPW
jgi:hypothetical protein